MGGSQPLERSAGAKAVLAQPFGSIMSFSCNEAPSVQSLLNTITTITIARRSRVLYNRYVMRRDTALLPHGQLMNPMRTRSSV